MYALILHWLKLLRKIDTIHCSAQSVFYFVDSNAWHLGKMVDHDIMVTRKFFFGINEGIQLAKHNSVINACLERPKLKNTTYASPQVQNENN